MVLSSLRCGKISPDSSVPIYKNMAEGPSCRSPYHEEYIQTSASGNPEDLCYCLLAAFIREKDECRVSCCILTAYVHTVLEQQLWFHPLLTEVVRYCRRTVLEDIFQGFPLVYRIVHSLSHQFVCHEFGILHHHDHLMMDTFKNRSRKLKSFFLNLLTAEFRFYCRNKSSFLNIIDRVYYIHRSSV